MKGVISPNVEESLRIEEAFEEGNDEPRRIWLGQVFEDSCLLGVVEEDCVLGAALAHRDQVIASEISRYGCIGRV